jgi:flagellar basal body-associated protein FliL
MAQEPSIPNENLEEREQTPAPEAKSSAFGKIKILFFVALVIGMECAVVYWYLPSAAESAALAGSAVEKKEDAKTAIKHEAEKDQNSQVEVDLGEFNVTAYQPVSNTTLRIDFHLYGTVAAAEQKLFMSRLEENQHRFREQVIVTVRSSEITDLTDAGLGLVKRKIMDKTNRMLGKQLLQTIIFSDFSFIEQ